MTDDERSLKEIEARLDELRDEKKQADELGERAAEARDALKFIQRHSLVDEAAAAEVGLLVDMLRHIRHCDINPSRRIHHERRSLRKARRRKKAEAESEREA
jgi:hypothetical protein